MMISSGIPRHRKHIFSAKNKKQTKSVTTDVKERLRNGEDTVKKSGITAECFVIKQIHGRVANRTSEISHRAPPEYK